MDGGQKRDSLFKKHLHGWKWARDREGLGVQRLLFRADWHICTSCCLFSFCATLLEDSLGRKGLLVFHNWLHMSAFTNSLFVYPLLPYSLPSSSPSTHLPPSLSPVLTLRSHQHVGRYAVSICLDGIVIMVSKH